MSGEKLAGKKAIVSGGSRGIGRGIALTLAAEGADVAFCHYKDDEKASQTVADIEALGRKAFAADCDVSSTSAIKDFYACLLYTSPSPRDLSTSRMPSSA